MTERPIASGVIRLAQDNARKGIEIVALSPGVSRLLLMDSAKLMGRDVREVLSPHVKQAVEDYVEFAADAKDVGDVLGKVRKVVLVNGVGEEIAVNVKMQPMGLDDTGRPLFDMVMRSAGMEEMRGNQVLARNMGLKGHEVLDPSTGLPEKNSFVRDLELVVHFLRRDGGHACLVAIMLCNYTELKRQKGAEKAEELCRKVAEACRTVLRGDDSLARLEPHSFGILLLDADLAAAPFALNRLRDALGLVRITLQDGLTVAPELGFALTEIQPQDSPEGLMQTLDKTLKEKMDNIKPGQYVEMRAA